MIYKARAEMDWVYRSQDASQVTNLGKSTHWQDFELSRLPLTVHAEHPHNDSDRANGFKASCLRVTQDAFLTDLCKKGIQFA